MKKLLSLLVCAAFLAALFGCKAEEPGPGGSTKRAAVQSDELQFAQPGDGALTATIHTTEGDIFVVLYPQYAPLAVENFRTLAQSGYYDGTEFHRVVQDFVIQGGDGTGSGSDGYSVWGEPYATEITDKLHHYAGALCAASDGGRPHTNQSQFYIVTSPPDSVDEAAAGRLRAAGVRGEVVDAYEKSGGAPWLDNVETVFGQVYAGMDVADAISGVAVNDAHRPKKPVTVTGITLGGAAAGGSSGHSAAG